MTVTVQETIGSSQLDLESAKIHLRIDGTDEDTYLQSLISSATSIAERYYGTPFSQATNWTIVYDPIPKDYKCLELPIRDVTFFTATWHASDDTDGTLTSRLSPNGVLRILENVPEKASYLTVTVSSLIVNNASTKKTILMQILAALYEHRGDDAMQHVNKVLQSFRV